MGASCPQCRTGVVARKLAAAGAAIRHASLHFYTGDSSSATVVTVHWIQVWIENGQQLPALFDSKSVHAQLVIDAETLSILFAIDVSVSTSKTNFHSDSCAN